MTKKEKVGAGKMAVHRREKESKRGSQNSIVKENLQYTTNCLQMLLRKWIFPGKLREARLVAADNWVI